MSLPWPKHRSILRCTADADELDERKPPRTLEYAEALIHAFDAQDLWDDFGMVIDLVVRTFASIRLT